MRNLFIVFFLAISIGLSAQSDIFPAYETYIHGENLSYHSPQDDADEALLIRSESSDNYLEWETGIVPADYIEEFVCFNLMMAMDVNPTDPHNWDVFINDEKIFTLSSPLDTLNKSILIEGKEKSEFQFDATEVDKYGDLMGYANLKIPVSTLEKGKPARIKIVAENARSTTWLIVYKYKMIPSVKIQAENAIHKGDDVDERVVKLEIVYYKSGALADVKIGSFQQQLSLNYGYNQSFVTFEADDQTQMLPYSIHVDGVLLDQGELKLEPVKQMTIYLVHHSHVDIGYTHVQTEVEEKQWSYIERCIDLSERSENNPPEARFKWNIEVMWALDSYWANASPEKKAKLKTAIQNGWIELDAFYGNELTALCSSEELLQLTTSAQEIANECSVELKSAMISDVPGWTWGIVPVLGQAGVEYLSLGTNTFHRIGYTIEEWGDKPFYWQSASGKDSILTWIHGKGYSSFHTGLGAENLKNKLDERILLTYMNELSDNKYPYDKIIMRYNIGSDNGPPDDMLTKKVMDWNERYESPKLVISTTSEAFEIFENAYGESLPVVTGDFTGYWEDGAASSARETALNRENAHALSQAQTLMAMNNVLYPDQKFSDVWQKIMLYNEHTWGSWNSISDPQADFTKQQWAIKQSFATDANSLSQELMQKALSERSVEESKFFEVINTHSWTVSDVVKISGEQASGFNSVEDEDGNRLLSQKLKDGSLVFIVSDIPAFSSQIFKLSKAKSSSHKQFEFSENTIENQHYRITINPDGGAVTELLWKDKNINLVSSGDFSGLNEYLYVEGRHAESQTNAGNCRVVLEEIGDVLLSVNVICEDLKGCQTMVNRYTLYNGLERIDIENELDKKEIYEQEAVHFAFPFNVPNGDFRYDLAYGVCKIEEDQIAGANRNFITIENWVDISNDEYGLTWISKDAPLIEAEGIYNDPTVEGYLKSLPETQTVISYIMNNYWETNYLAAQSGKHTFQYSLLPHNGYNSAFSERRALEIQQPLVIHSVGKRTKPLSFELALNNDNLMIQSVVPLEEEGQYLIRIFNAGNQAEKIQWKNKPANVSVCDFKGDESESFSSEAELLPMELVTLLVDLK